MQIFNVLKKPVQKESERPSDLRPVTAREVKAETPGFSSRAQGTQVPPCDLLGCPKGGLCIWPLETGMLYQERCFSQDFHEYCDSTLFSHLPVHPFTDAYCVPDFVVNAKIDLY